MRPSSVTLIPWYYEFTIVFNLKVQCQHEHYLFTEVKHTTRNTPKLYINVTTLRPKNLSRLICWIRGLANIPLKGL